MPHNDNLLAVDQAWYLSRYKDVAENGIGAEEHYQIYGKQEGRFPNTAAAEILTCDGFDRAWYGRFYSDIIAVGTDPTEHYLTSGKESGRFPNPESLQRASLLEMFDPIWYLARNRDVAKSGVKPAEHFLQYGYEEGRSPNERLESRARWRRWFDLSWYTARYPDAAHLSMSPLEHYLRIGIYEGRAPHPGADDREEWDKIVDGEWYAERYGDVAASGLSPLDHFIKYGIIAHRRPNAVTEICSDPVECASVEVIKHTVVSENVVLFVTFTPTEHLRPHIVHHLRAFKAAALSTVLIIATDSSTVEIDDEVHALATVILKRENKGFDFAAWAHAFRLYPDLFNKDSLIFANDSTFGPFNDDAFVEMYRKLHGSKADIVGLTSNDEFGWHLQSYFLLLKRTALRSTAFQNFMASVVSFQRKEEVIYEYETQFTQKMLGQGLHCEVLYDAIDATNPTYYRWRDLIERGFPYIKVSVLIGDAVKRGVGGWRGLLRERGYRTSDADRTLAENYLIGPPDKHLDFSRGLIAQRNALYNLHRFLASDASIAQTKVGTPKFCLVVVSHNRAEYLLSLLKEIRSYGNLDELELLLVNNGSNDETSELCSRLLGFPILNYPSPVDTATILRDAALKSQSPCFIILNNALYFDTKVIDAAKRLIDGLSDERAIAGSVKQIIGYAISPYPPRDETEHACFRRPVCSAFEDTGDEASDYLFIFNKACLDRCDLSETVSAADPELGMFLSRIFTKAGIRIEADPQLEIALI